jgi:hypothetical protein
LLETLGFAGRRRKRHAETTEPSGKYGVEVKGLLAPAGLAAGEAVVRQGQAQHLEQERFVTNDKDFGGHGRGLFGCGG